MKTKTLFNGSLLALLLVNSTLTSCKKDDEKNDKSGTFYGIEVPVGNGKAKTFITTDETGAPIAVGVQLTDQALVNLPNGSHLHTTHAEAPSYTLPLPQQKLHTPFDHVTLDWNPHGHPPENVFDKPHFDVHFYMMSEQERLTITGDDPKIEDLPEPRFLPESFVPIAGGVPQMGKHWVDPSSMSGTFTQAFLYGTYDKRVTFYEPMVTLAYLQSKPDSVSLIAQPEAFLKTGVHYPSRYRVKYDAGNKVYLIVLEDFKLNSRNRLFLIST
ncbi:DUF5602 domain-containing protein [Desertivirga xinjiangensis]|uniref:DUF5602 domain-containing protein n=1 Tax=Desertivirga xinjiangensis TaxID=539206 RepID=UPI00210C4603|nr:DUF5602 domain-containing protein [Pedobacter xinjiangensis]